MDCPHCGEPVPPIRLNLTIPMPTTGDLLERLRAARARYLAEERWQEMQRLMCLYGADEVRSGAQGEVRTCSYYRSGELVHVEVEGCSHDAVSNAKDN